MAALVLYASLYPFSGWRWPAGSAPPALLALPWLPWLTPLDELLNLIGYVPLGLLVFISGVRGGRSAWRAALAAVLAAAALSYACEVLQHLLPQRHPSLKDWLMNTCGAAVGAGLGLLLRGSLQRWQHLRQRWFVRHSEGALALLALWPAALLFPTALPWGLGRIGPRVVETLQGWVDGVPWAEGVAQMLAEPAPLEPLSHLAERVASALGLLAPVLLAYAVSRPGWHRLWLALGAIALGLAGTTVSTVLNFGPAHAGSWLTAAAGVGAAGAVLVAVALAPVPQRVVQLLGVVALVALLLLVDQAPADPYFADTLQAWEQGRFVRFHGLAQWVGWLWPFAALGWLVARLLRPEEPGRAGP
jgi:VanZ family protein